MGCRVFNDLDEEIKYVNNQLLNGRSLTKIAIEDYEYKSESSLRKKLTKGNVYKRVGQQFIRQCYEDSNTNYNEKESFNNVIQNVGQDVSIVENPSVLENIDMSDMTKSPSVTLNIIDDKFKGLLSNYDILMKMIDEYKSLGMQSINDNRLAINLPADKGEARVTFRINGTVYEEFQRFVEDHKQFKVKELVSAALQEFVNKYK